MNDDDKNHNYHSYYSTNPPGLEPPSMYNNNKNEQDNHNNNDSNNHNHNPPPSGLIPLEQSAQSNDNNHTTSSSIHRIPYGEKPETPPLSATAAKEETDKDCCTWYWNDCVWPGLGLFGESYLLFSIGTMQPIWQVLLEECFDEDCAPSLWAALKYSVVVGVLVGMLVVGMASRYTGRRTGSLLTAMCMASGAAGLTLTSLFLTQDDQETCLRSMVFFWGVFGVGVGGEYPLAAAQACENASSEPPPVTQTYSGEEPPPAEPAAAEVFEDEPRLSSSSLTSQQQQQQQQLTTTTHRGRQVQLVFSMQGVGILLNSVTMTVLLGIAAWRSSTNNEEEQDNFNLNAALLAIWRSTYGFGTLVLIFVWYSRYLYLQESKVWLQHQQQELEEQEELIHNNNLLNNKPSDPPLQVILEGGARGTGTAPGDVSSSTTPNPLPQLKEVLSTPDRLEHNKNDQDSSTDPAGLCTPETGIGAVAPGPTPTKDDDNPLTTPKQSNVRAPAPPPSVPQLPQQAQTHEQQQQQQSSLLSPFMSLQPRPQKPDAAVTTASPGPALDMVPTISMVSTVSSLSAPSLLAHNMSSDEDYYYHFMPNGNGKANHPHHGNHQANGEHPWHMWRLLWRHYGVRLLGVSGCWLLWDVSFYGNKIFQSTFLLALLQKNTDQDDNADNSDLLDTLLNLSLCATLNAAVALAGYLVAAILVDQPMVGRRRLQQWGLLVTGGLFVVCGFSLDSASYSSSNWVVLLYLGTSFFGQVGPNCTSFLIPAEIFPTEIRTVSHGIAAASGKLGALLAAVLFNYTSSELDMFLLCGYACLLAGALTFWTIPESLGLPLQELDRKWHCIVRNQPYHGLANHARFLSVYERNQLKHQASKSVTGNDLTPDHANQYQSDVEIY